MVIDLDALRGKPAETSETTETPAETTETQETTEVTDEVESTTEATKTTEEQADPYKDIDLSKVKVGDLPVSQIVAEREALQKEKEELAERFKRIESDEWLKNFLDEYQSGGDVEKYLSAKVDWDKKDDLEVLRVGFEKKNSDLDPELMDVAFRKEMINKYGIDPFDEDTDTESADYKYAMALKKRDANKVRSEFKEEQGKYSVPKAKEINTPQANVEDFKKKVLEDNDVKSILDKKLLQLDVKSESGDSFNYELESAEPIVEMMWDESKFWNLFLTPEGKVDLKKAAKVFAYAKDPQKFESQVFDWGKQSGTESLVKKKKGISDGTTGKPTSTAKQSDKKELAKAIFGAWK